MPRTRHHAIAHPDPAHPAWGICENACSRDRGRVPPTQVTLRIERRDQPRTAAMTAPTVSLSLPERLPTVGELVQVRARRWLVEEVIEPENPGHSSLIRLACADDDNQGQTLDVFWDYEPDRRILEEEGWANLASKPFRDGAHRSGRGRMDSQFRASHRARGEAGPRLVRTRGPRDLRARHTKGP